MITIGITIGIIALTVCVGYCVCTFLLKIAEAFQGRKAAKEQEVEQWIAERIKKGFIRKVVIVHRRKIWDRPGPFIKELSLSSKTTTILIAGIPVYTKEELFGD